MIFTSSDYRIITSGQSFTFTVKRNDSIYHLKKLLYNNYKNKASKNEIKLYNLYTRNMVKLYNDNIIMDLFKNPNDNYLNIYDKNENIIYACLIK